MTQGKTPADRRAVWLVVDIENNRHTRRRRIGQHTVINKSISVRNSKTRSLFRKSRGLGQIEIIRHEGIDDVIGEALVTWVRCAFGWTVPRFGNLKTRTHLGFVVPNILDLRAA